MHESTWNQFNATFMKYSKQKPSYFHSICWLTQASNITHTFLSLGVKLWSVRTHFARCRTWFIDQQNLFGKFEKVRRTELIREEQKNKNESHGRDVGIPKHDLNGFYLSHLRRLKCVNVLACAIKAISSIEYRACCMLRLFLLRGSIALACYYVLRINSYATLCKIWINR